MDKNKTDSTFLELCKLIVDKLSEDDTREKIIGQILALKFGSKMSEEDYIQYMFYKALGEIYRCGFRDGGNSGLDQAASPVTAEKARVYFGARSNQRSIPADEFAMKMSPFIQEIRSTGPVSLQQIADQLNARGLHAVKGGIWHPASVRSLESRIEKMRRKFLAL